MKKEEKIEYVEEGLDDAARKIEKLRKILKNCKKERQEYLEGWQRARADHQNYIKQMEQDMGALRKFASEGTMLQFIPILDNLILACESIPESIAEDNWAKGIVQVRKHFESVLKENGIEAIDAKPGDKFDPAHHESVEGAPTTPTQRRGVGVPTPAGVGRESGTIAEVLQKGYTLNGKVIRAARVKVNK